MNRIDSVKSTSLPESADKREKVIVQYAIKLTARQNVITWNSTYGNFYNPEGLFNITSR